MLVIGAEALHRRRVLASLNISCPLMLTSCRSRTERTCAPTGELRRERGHAQQIVREHERPSTDRTLGKLRTDICNRPRLRARAFTHSAVAARCL